MRLAADARPWRGPAPLARSIVERLRAASPTGWLAMTAAAALATLMVGVVQVMGRGPLEWDESTRVHAGWWFAYWLSAGDLGAVWHWINDQTLYPFLAPMLNGLLLFFGAGSIAAAALPSMLAYGAAGVLAGRLAWEAGGGRLGAWAAALLFWLTPMEARLAAGAFTEPLGIAGELGLLALLLHLRHNPRLRIALFSSAVAVGLLFLKWDYGILGFAVLALTGMLVAEDVNAFKVRRMYDIALLAGIALAVPFLLVNLHAKIGGLMTFASVDNPAGPSGIDLTYLPKALFANAQVGISPITALLLVAAVVWAVVAWRKIVAVRPLLVFAVLSYIAYSSAIYRETRYFAATIAVLASLAGAALGQLWPIVMTQAEAARKRPAVLAGAALCACVILITQLPAVAVRDFRIEHSTAALQVVQFAVSQLDGPTQPVVLLGPTTETSPQAIQLAWEQQHGQPGPLVTYVPEAAPADRKAALIRNLLGVMPGRVLAIEVAPGSQLDTVDYRDFWPGQRTYIDYAASFEAAGCLRRLAVQGLDNGRIRVTAWEVVNGPLSFSDCLGRAGS